MLLKPTVQPQSLLEIKRYSPKCHAYPTYGIGSFGQPLGFAGAVYSELRSWGLDATYRLE